MIKKFIYLFLFLSFSINGQQTINKLITKELTVQDKVEVTSTTKSSKPCPVMTEVQRDAISSPATGSCVYNSDSLQLNVYDGSTWQEAGGGGISLWATGLSYDVNDVVTESDRIYRCLIAHTSGTFSTDLASGNWTEVSGSIPVSLQDVYEDSNQPQITTNTSGLGIQFKRGSLNDTDVVVEVLNGAGTSKFSVTGEGAVSAGSTITATGNITGANLSGTNTGNSTVDAASGYIGGAGMQVVEVPNAQVTSIDLANKKVRFEFGNNNELINANMEAQTVAEGWTVTNATSSSSTTRIEGSKSLSLALTGALSLSQSSTINAAQKSGVQMVASIWVNSSDVSDLQLCSLKNGSEDKCTVTGGYVQGSGWRQLTVSFLGNSTSNGLKLKSTDTTGTVLVDQAFVGVGSPIVDFTNSTDWEEFTPTFTGIGTPSSVKAFWKRTGDTLEVYGRATSGTVAASGFTINFSSLGVLIDTSKVVSDATKGQIAGTFARDSADGVMFNIGFNSTSTNWVYVADGGALGGLRDSDASAIINSSEKFTFKFSVPIAGWGGKSSKAYVASSSDTDWASCGHTTSDFTGFGTVSAINLQCKRKGGDLKIKGSFITGSPSSVEARINLRFNGLPVSASSSISGTQIAGYSSRNVANNGASIYTNLITANSGYFTLSFANNAIANPLISQQGSALIVSGDTYVISNELSIPIQGWTDSGVIVGSFQGYNETPGTSRVETFSLSFGETATAICDGTGLVNTNQCAYLDQIGNAVTNVTRVGLGEYVVNTARNYSKLKCALIMGNPVTFTTTYIINYTANSFSFTTTNASTKVDTYGTIICQGTPQ